MFIPLKELIAENELKTIDILKTFKCSKDKEIEDFICNKSISFEKSNLCRTFLQFDNKNNLLGFYSIAANHINISKTVSKTLTKRLNKCGALRTTINAFLIAQIAKNDGYSDTKGKTLLEEAIRTIKAAQNLIAGKIIFVECKNIEKIKDFYISNGFKYIQDNEENGLKQFYCII
jgi:hypothetical protein